MNNDLLKNALAVAQMGRSMGKGNFIISTNEEMVSKELLNSMENEINNTIEDTGSKVDLTTLTQVKAQVIKQKFYEVSPAEFIPMKIGNGAFMDDLLTWKAFSHADDFESGNILQGHDNSRIKSVNASLKSIRTKIVPWAKSLQYSLFEIQQATKSGNWSRIEALETARKRSWDLGIQKIAFLGANADTGLTGLLNNANVTIDTATITESISGMTDTEFQTFVAAILKAYSANANATVLPDTFLIPLSDWLGLGISTSATYPLRDRIDYLESLFKKLTKNPNFKIAPLAYGDTAHNSLGKTRYVLYRRNPDSLDMNLPIDYTSLAVGSLNNFQFQSVAYGQYTGVEVYRPKEMLYFDY